MALSRKLPKSIAAARAIVRTWFRSYRRQAQQLPNGRLDSSLVDADEDRSIGAVLELQQLWDDGRTDDPNRPIDRARQQLGEQGGDVNVFHGVGRVAVHADRRIGVENAERLADAVALQERVSFVPGDRLAEECV